MDEMDCIAGGHYSNCIYDEIIITEGHQEEPGTAIQDF